MEITYTNAIAERMYRLMYVHSLNSIVMNGLILPMQDAPYFNKKDVDKYITEIKKDKTILENQTLDEIQMSVIITSIMKESGAMEEITPGLFMYLVRESQIFHKGDLESTPYIKNIHIGNHKIGRFELTTSDFDPYEVFQYTTPRDTEDGIHIPRVGLFDYKFKAPAIKEDGNAWMTITPAEFYTIERPIKKAKGNVLTLGCGLGYFAYMASEKQDVSHVTIIEKQPEVIELFNEYILPQFSHKEKISVVQADAIEYADQIEDGEYDYVFADIWRGNTDVWPYIYTKQKYSQFTKTKVDYWIEKAVVEDLLSYVRVYLFDSFMKAVGDEGVALPKEMPKIEKKTYDYMGKLLQDVSITKPEHIDYYLNWQRIASMVGKSAA